MMEIAKWRLLLAVILGALTGGLLAPYFFEGMLWIVTDSFRCLVFGWICGFIFGCLLIHGFVKQKCLTQQ